MLCVGLLLSRLPPHCWVSMSVIQADYGAHSTHNVRRARLTTQESVDLEGKILTETDIGYFILGMGFISSPFLVLLPLIYIFFNQRNLITCT